MRKLYNKLNDISLLVTGPGFEPLPSHPLWIGSCLPLPRPFVDPLDTYLGTHDILCGRKELHLPCLAFRDSNGTVSLQIEVLLATDVQLAWGSNKTPHGEPDATEMVSLLKERMYSSRALCSYQLFTGNLSVPQLRWKRVSKS